MTALPLRIENGNGEVLTFERLMTTPTGERLEGTNDVQPGAAGRADGLGYPRGTPSDTAWSLAVISQLGFHQPARNARNRVPRFTV